MSCSTEENRALKLESMATIVQGMKSCGNEFAMTVEITEKMFALMTEVDVCLFTYNVDQRIAPFYICIF
jgi:hypothetical protein